MSHKLHGAGHERVSPLTNAGVRICNLAPQSGFLLLPQAALEPVQNTQMKGTDGYTLYVA